MMLNLAISIKLKSDLLFC